MPWELDRQQSGAGGGVHGDTTGPSGLGKRIPGVDTTGLGFDEASDALTPAAFPGYAGQRALLDPDVEQVMERWPDGIMVSFYADHASNERDISNNDKEIRRRAESQAEDTGAVGLDGGKLALGQAIPIDDKEEVAAGLDTICGRLEASLPEADVAEERHQVKHLLIYAHGWETGLGTGAGYGKKHNVNMKDIPEFVSAMAANLRGDVNLSLNACTTASSGEAGEGSFADEMHQALLDEGKDESRVVGHYSAGHTTGNSDVRVFEQGLESKQTGAEDQELFFDRCFSDADIQTAADDYGVTVEKAHQKLRKWYRKYLSFWRKNSNKEDRFDVGFVIMMEPDRAVAILRDAWQQASGFKDYSPRPHIDMQTLGRDDADTRRLEEQEQSAAGVDVINGLTVID